MQFEMKQFVGAVEALQRRLVQVPGAVSRQVFRCPESGEWTELALWENRETAKQAEREIMASPDEARGFAMIDEGMLRMRFMERVL